MNIAGWLEDQAKARGAAPAIFYGHDMVCDYAGFRDRAARMAGAFLARGLKPGDRVAIFMGNHPDYLISLFGVWYAGLVAVPINARLHGKEAAWIIDNAGATLCVSTGAQAEVLKGVVDVLTPEVLSSAPVAYDASRVSADLAWLFYTSGTTGRPKGVQITHGMLRVMSESYLTSVDEVTSDDATLYAAPMSHGAGLYALVHVLKGARHIVPVSGGFDPGELLDLAAHFDRLHVFAAPTMLTRLTVWAQEAGRTGRGLRSLVLGGAPLYEVDLRAALAQFGPVFLQIYGQGEAPMGITALGREDIVAGRKLTTVGQAQSGVSLRITNGSGAILKSGQIGEVEVRGDLVMPGYWQNPKATAETLRDGWLRTGDMGHLDDEGYLTLVDRSKDMIISGGQNIYPREVEEVLLTHPDVVEASVIGRPSEQWGEEVVAFVVAHRKGLNEAALDAHCLANIARFKRPKAYVFVEDIPKNNYGKVLKTALRDRLSGG
ncbi:class I adenylate-forming enzyme family protein [Roseovarius rhodophyticola]|uniref:AMP-binding protein n=1 Tax=Roseovarius rhodophyticola TaxID=3080827 RepID=A0ABZ2TCX1_9RHOB|nr:AMP-binding protein [Roseovarius sp. W115]MDV2931297.1 AMP-binding protein [Roseovarius sp. W115]